MTLKSVDLPAPFGPMTENTSPARTAKLTSASAASAPKLFDTPLDLEHDSAGHRAACRAAGRAATRRNPRRPVRREQHDQDQHQPDDDRVPLDVRRHLLLEQR